MKELKSGVVCEWNGEEYVLVFNREAIEKSLGRMAGKFDRLLHSLAVSDRELQQKQAETHERESRERAARERAERKARGKRLPEEAGMRLLEVPK